MLAMCGAVFSFCATDRPEGAISLMTFAGVRWTLVAVRYGVVEVVGVFKCLRLRFSCPSASNC